MTGLRSLLYNLCCITKASRGASVDIVYSTLEVISAFKRKCL